VKHLPSRADERALLKRVRALNLSLSYYEVRLWPKSVLPGRMIAVLRNTLRNTDDECQYPDYPPP
jgi:hypothetical protein